MKTIDLHKVMDAVVEIMNAGIPPPRSRMERLVLVKMACLIAYPEFRIPIAVCNQLVDVIQAALAGELVDGTYLTDGQTLSPYLDNSPPPEGTTLQ